MKKISVLLVCILPMTQAFCQNGQLPPAYFPSGKNVCDNNPWKLVLYDQFNGETLNAPWITFVSWAGMPGGDNDNWSEARLGTNGGHSIYRDANVVVSNGTVKLQVKKEQNSWQCSSCSMSPLQKNYSSAILALPYTKAFNAGKFEASIKMPTFKYAHSTFWTWYGSSVNEIDIAEGYGQSIGGLWGGFPRVNYSLHAWAPPPQQNPYNMQHVEVMNRYPNQTWWNWLWNNGFKIDQFHTYTCEWDTAIIKFFVDGNLVSEQWKYYQTKSYKKWWQPWKTYYYQVGSGCNPSSGTWNVMKGFPYNNQSSSNLRFTADLDEPNTYANNSLLGQMEID